MAVMNFSVPRNIVYGEGSMEKLASLEGKKAALVTGGSSMKKFGFLDQAETYLKEAENVTLQAQQSGLSAWSNQVGVQNRFQIIDNLLSPGLKQFRTTMYEYHRNGFDEMAENNTKGKAAIENSLISLDRLYNKVIGNPLLRLFFDAKADEIVNLYSDGPNTRSKQRLLVVLQKISPNNSAKWRKIN